MNKLKRITVTRMYESITKTIVSCKECPWYREERDMNATLCCCDNPDFNTKKASYGNIITDIGSPWDNTPIISTKCPYLKDESLLVWRHNIPKN